MFRNHLMMAGSKITAAGGGGGPVEYFAAVLQEGGTTNEGDGPWTSGSFSPTAGRRLVALVSITADSAVDFASSGEILDSQGTTWTPLGGVNHASAGLAQKAFISTPVPSSTGTTVTLNAGADSISRYRIAIFEVTGTAGTIEGFTSNGAAATDGADSLTLAATPTADDLCVYMRTRNATGGFIIGSSYVEVVDADLTNVGVGIAVNDNTTSTGISITDARDGGGSAGENVHMAFILKAG